MIRGLEMGGAVQKIDGRREMEMHAEQTGIGCQEQETLKLIL